ncbi:MAG: putative glycolipid-binding domain-containing protein [Candidatus Rokuibacteriota bacterium]
MPVEKGSVTDQSVLWRRLDQPGHESARLFSRDAFWQVSGTAVFAHNQEPCRLDYLVVCDAEWQTLSGRVAGWVGNGTVEIELSVDPARRWRLNGTECPEVAGCIDLDLNFSPSTNVLPIRRLSLAIGHEATVRAAWLRFPGFTLEPLDQLYRRLDAATYQYESGGGRFVTELQVNAAGLVTLYPRLWQLEASA